MQLAGWKTVLGASLDDLSVLSAFHRACSRAFASGEFEAEPNKLEIRRLKAAGSLRACRGQLSG
jgi:hypothetical protein